MGLMLLLTVPTTPTRVAAMGELLTLPAYENNPPVPINCSKAVMTTAPKFLSTPKGSARYPFLMKCTSGERAGLMLFTWEGRWNPSETRQDRPNAVESLFIEGWEPFIPGRTGGKLFMYWTARCTDDPWLQGGTCHRYGGYVPDDLRDAFPNIDGRTFPLTEKSISPALRQQLVKNYQRVNSQVPKDSRNRQNLQSMTNQPQQSQAIISQRRQAQTMIVKPETAVPKPDSTMGSVMVRPRIFPRGVEPTDPQQSGSQEQDVELATVETPAIAVPEEDTDEITGTAAFPLDRPLHVTSATGDAVVIEPGIYEIEPILGLQLGLAKEGQPTLILHANPGTHSESIQRTMALTIPGQSDGQQHLVLLTPAGKRFDAPGSTSGVTSRGAGVMAPLSERTLKDAILAASAKPELVSPPPCHPNPDQIGPRWMPVPCTFLTIPAPTP